MIIAALPGKHSMVTGQQHADGGFLAASAVPFLFPKYATNGFARPFPRGVDVVSRTDRDCVQLMCRRDATDPPDRDPHVLCSKVHRL